LEKTLMPIRQPIVCVLGHVDTGKTSLLDTIRETSVQAREAGGMTQHIGASFFPLDTLRQLVGPLLSSIKGEVEIPGLLIVDTPGHEAFTNLRRRGGSVADIAILVIDMLKNFEAQTYECLDILKARKTPFVVAVNKMDRIPGWRTHANAPFLQSYGKQDAHAKEELDNRLYQIMGVFSRLGFRTDRFDRIRRPDFASTIALVPTSAKTGEGLPELIMVLVGLTQQFMKKQLQTTEGPGKGSVLEVKEEPGLGLTLNTIVYDGSLQKDDLIVVGGREKPVVTRIRAILVPKPLDEIRDPRDRFSSVESVFAAAGVKIVAPGLEGALAGAPLYVVPPNEQVADYSKLVTEEVGHIRIATDVAGVIVKADTLGSLEAIADILKKSNVPIRIADVGDISKRDVIEASVVKAREPLLGAILAFGVKILPDADQEAAASDIRIFREPIIYNMIEQYLEWARSKREAKTEEEFERLIKPGKIQVMAGFIFRRAKPAIFGVEVVGGQIQPKYSLMRAEDYSDLGEVQQIQDKGKSVSKAKTGMQVAISMDDPIVGRHVFERDFLYVKVPEADAKILLSTYLEKLSPGDQELMREYVDVMRKKVPFWGAF
jgi:translation initiation factor 5B